MKAKTLLILFILLLIVVCIVAYPSFQTKFFAQKAKKNEISLSAFTEKNTSEITLQKEKTALTIKKDAADWKVASFSASPSKIEALFSAIQEANPETIVSKNPNNLNEYQLASDSGIQVTMRGFSGTGTIILGKAGPENGSYYAKNIGSPNVYLVDGNLVDVISMNVSDWRNKTVVNVKATDVNSISISDDIAFTATKNNDTSWNIEEKNKKGSLDANLISSALSAFSPLEGFDFLNSDEAQTFTTSKKGSILMKDKTNTTLIELTYLKQDSNYWVKENNHDDIVKVNGSSLDSLLKLPESLK